MTPESTLDAFTTIAEALSGELSLDEVLERVVDVARSATGARYAALGVVGDDETIERFVHAGIDDEQVRRIGPLPTGKGILGLLIREPRTIRLDDLGDHPASVGFPEHHPPMTTFLGTPVLSGGRVYGNLYLTDKEGGFDARDEQIIEALATQAGIAIDNALLADRLKSLAVQEERERISRDLHDGIIQTLFSIGMGLESARGLVDSAPERVASRLDGAVDSIDSAIRELRNTIFQLRADDAAELGLRRGLIELAREHEVNAITRPDLDLPLELDAPVPPSVVPDALQIVREALSNVARHAQASFVRVAAETDNGVLNLVVTDDGVGFHPGRDGIPGHGLTNIRERAELHGGKAIVDSAPGEGTSVTVELPLEDAG